MSRHIFNRVCNVIFGNCLFLRRRNATEEGIHPNMKFTAALCDLEYRAPTNVTDLGCRAERDQRHNLSVNSA